MKERQPEFILQLKATLSKEDSNAIQEALNAAYTYGYYAHMRQVCKHSFVDQNKKKSDICALCGVSYIKLKEQNG